MPSMNWLRPFSRRRKSVASVGIFVSVVDTYQNVDLNRGSINDTVGRVPVGRDEIHQGRTAVLLIFGQSNGANSGSAPFTPTRRVLNFNLFDGRCYVAKDPLLGCTEQQGNFASRLGEKLIAGGHFDTVVLAPISVGGSRIEEWTTGGARHRRLQIAIQRAKDLGLTFTHLLWHQGESDANDRPDGKQYARCFMDIVDALRRYGVEAPIYVAQATVCESGPNEAIRAAQQSVVDPARGIYAGPDTDRLGAEYRFDGCHMNEAGLVRHAELWLDVLTKAAP